MAMIRKGLKGEELCSIDLFSDNEVASEEWLIRGGLIKYGQSLSSQGCVPWEFTGTACARSSTIRFAAMQRAIG